MKRVFLFVALMALVMVSVAEASIWSTVKDGAINGGLTVIFAVIAGLFGKKWLTLKAPIQAIIEVFRKYRSAKLLQSEDGKDISKAEWNAIFQEMTVAVEALIAAIPAKWLPKTAGK